MQRRMTTWDTLLLDASAAPMPVDEARFRQWMAGQRVFVSSVMDAEMTPYREAVRTYLEEVAPGAAVMWETISPRDEGPVRAFLTGVDTSTLFVLMLGRSYGVSDDTGFSPTAKEAERATERHLARLLFTTPAPSSERDGKLNRWLGSLYAEIAGNAAADPAGLAGQLDARLRELAARAERNWIKLGRCVFPGRVETSGGRGGRSFTVTVRTRDAGVLGALRSTAISGGGDLRLTWGLDSFPVVVDDVREQSEFAGEADLTITCKTPQNWHGGGNILAHGSVNGVGPDELAQQWTRHAVFGEPVVENWQGIMGAFTRPDTPPLPEVLAATGAAGWQAEGLVRLYAVEEVARQRGGRFGRLAVGPATAVGVRIDGEFRTDAPGVASSAVPVSGFVKLSRVP